MTPPHTGREHQLAPPWQLPPIHHNPWLWTFVSYQPHHHSPSILNTSFNWWEGYMVPGQLQPGQPQWNPGSWLNPSSLCPLSSPHSTQYTSSVVPDHSKGWDKARKRVGGLLLATVCHRPKAQQRDRDGSPQSINYQEKSAGDPEYLTTVLGLPDCHVHWEGKDCTIRRQKNASCCQAGSVKGQDLTGWIQLFWGVGV